MKNKLTKDATPAEIIKLLGGGHDIIIEIPENTPELTDTTELKQAGISGKFRVNPKLKEPK